MIKPIWGFFAEAKDGQKSIDSLAGQCLNPEYLFPTCIGSKKFSDNFEFFMDEDNLVKLIGKNHPHIKIKEFLKTIKDGDKETKKEAYKSLFTHIIAQGTTNSFYGYEALGAKDGFVEGPNGEKVFACIGKNTLQQMFDHRKKDEILNVLKNPKTAKLLQLYKKYKKRVASSGIGSGTDFSVKDILERLRSMKLASVLALGTDYFFFSQTFLLDFFMSYGLNKKDQERLKEENYSFTKMAQKYFITDPEVTVDVINEFDRLVDKYPEIEKLLEGQGSLDRLITYGQSGGLSESLRDDSWFVTLPTADYFHALIGDYTQPPSIFGPSPEQGPILSEAEKRKEFEQNFNFKKRKEIVRTKCSELHQGLNAMFCGDPQDFSANNLTLKNIIDHDSKNSPYLQKYYCRQHLCAGLADVPNPVENLQRSGFDKGQAQYFVESCDQVNQNKTPNAIGPLSLIAKTPNRAKGLVEFNSRLSGPYFNLLKEVCNETKLPPPYPPYSFGEMVRKNVDLYPFIKTYYEVCSTKSNNVKTVDQEVYCEKFQTFLKSDALAGRFKLSNSPLDLAIAEELRPLVGDFTLEHHNPNLVDYSPLLTEGGQEAFNVLPNLTVEELKKNDKLYLEELVASQKRKRRSKSELYQILEKVMASRSVAKAFQTGVFGIATGGAKVVGALSGLGAWLRGGDFQEILEQYPDLLEAFSKNPEQAEVILSELAKEVKNAAKVGRAGLSVGEARSLQSVATAITATLPENQREKINTTLNNSLKLAVRNAKISAAADKEPEADEARTTYAEISLISTTEDSKEITRHRVFSTTTVTNPEPTGNEDFWREDVYKVVEDSKDSKDNKGSSQKVGDGKSSSKSIIGENELGKINITQDRAPANQENAVKASPTNTQVVSQTQVQTETTSTNTRSSQEPGQQTIRRLPSKEEFSGQSREQKEETISSGVASAGRDLLSDISQQKSEEIVARERLQAALEKQQEQTRQELSSRQDISEVKRNQLTSELTDLKKQFAENQKQLAAAREGQANTEEELKKLREMQSTSSTSPQAKSSATIESKAALPQASQKAEQGQSPAVQPRGPVATTNNTVATPQVRGPNVRALANQNNTITTNTQRQSGPDESVGLPGSQQSQQLGTGSVSSTSGKRLAASVRKLRSPQSPGQAQPREKVPVVNSLQLINLALNSDKLTVEEKDKDYIIPIENGYVAMVYEGSEAGGKMVLRPMKVEEDGTYSISKDKSYTVGEVIKLLNTNKAKDIKQKLAKLKSIERSAGESITKRFEILTELSNEIIKDKIDVSQAEVAVGKDGKVGEDVFLDEAEKELPNSPL